MLKPCAASLAQVNTSIVRHPHNQWLQRLRRATRINHHQQSHFTTCSLQLLCHLIGKCTFGAESGDEIEAVLLDPQDGIDLMCGELGEVVRQPHLELVGYRQSDQGLILAQMPRQLCESREPADREQRRKWPLRMKRNSREQCHITAIATKRRRQTLDRWRLEHCGERNN